MNELIYIYLYIYLYIYIYSGNGTLTEGNARALSLPFALEREVPADTYACSLTCPLSTCGK